MLNQNKIQKKDSYFPCISGWFKNINNKFLVLLHLIRFKCPFEVIKYQVIYTLTDILIYPPTRIILGKIKARSICGSFSDFFCSPIFSLPFPLKSKLVMRYWTDHGLYDEIYVKDIYFQETLREGAHVIDVGSHIGAYTILAAEKVGKQGKVIAVEPGPKNYKQLIENIKLNGFKNVIPKNIALADHEGVEKLYLSHFLPFTGHSLIFYEDKDFYIKVPVKTIDKLVEELNLNKVDIIKIDTEGAEMPILRGAEKTLKANPNMRMIIAAEHYPSEAKEVCQFLNERGFKTKVFPNDIVMTV
jgi:FkbM family methyltransferase